MESGQSSSTLKKERKIIEKNRRNLMKSLYSQLTSLLPDHTSKEVLPLPDQIDEAVNHIKSLHIKLEKMKDEKEKLLGRKRSHACITSEITESSKSPQIQIHEMGPDLNVILINGLDNHSKFNEIIRVLHEEGAEVVHANFSTSTNSIFHVVQNKIGTSMFTFGADAISLRLKEVIQGSSGAEMESQLGLWDFEIQHDLWDLEIPEVMPMGILG